MRRGQLSAADRAGELPPAAVRAWRQEANHPVRGAIGDLGLAFLALAISGAVLLVTDTLFRATAEAIVSGALLALFAWLWFGVAWLRAWRS